MRPLRVCIVLHVGVPDLEVVLFYLHFVSALISRYSKVSFDVNVSVSVPELIPILREVLSSLPTNNTHLEEVCNAGADLAPFVDFLLSLETHYAFVLKLHTKRKLLWSYELLLALQSLPQLMAAFAAGAYIVASERYVEDYVSSIQTQDYLEDMNRLMRDFGVDASRLYTGPLPVSRRDFQKCSLSSYIAQNEDVFEAFEDLKDAEAHMLLAMTETAPRQGIWRPPPCGTSFVAGTIFAMSGNGALGFRKRHDVALRRHLSTIRRSELGYVSDEYGRRFTFTHGLERVLGVVGRVVGLKPCSTMLRGPARAALLPQIIKLPTIVVHSHDLSATGAPLFALELCRELRRKMPGHRLLVTCSEEGYLSQDFRALAEVWCACRPGEPPDFSYQGHRELARRYAELLSKTDPSLLYVNTVADVYPLFAAAKMTRRGRRVVLHSHEAELTLTDLLRSNRLPFYGVATLADDVICVNCRVSELLQGWAISQGLHLEAPPRIVPIHLPFDPQEPPDAVLLELKRAYRMTVGTCGTPCARKGYDHFERMASALPDVLFVWANIEETAVPNSPNFVHRSYSRAEMASFYRAIDLFLLTSRSESFSFGVREALQSGTPVLHFRSTLPYISDEPWPGAVTILPGLPSVETMTAALRRNLWPRGPARSQDRHYFWDGILPLLLQPAPPRELPTVVGSSDNTSLWSLFKGYAARHTDLRLTGHREGIEHFVRHGFREGRCLYRPPVRAFKTLLFVLHKGATTVGLRIAVALQQDFNVILLSRDDHPLNCPPMENPPIALRLPLHRTRYSYLRRLEEARLVLGELKPDIVYVNSACCHEYAHAALDGGLPLFYHCRESRAELLEYLGGSIVPFRGFFSVAVKRYPRSSVRFASFSSECTALMRELLGVEAAVRVFGCVDATSIRARGAEAWGYPLPSGHRRFGMIGRRSLLEGFDIFLTLAKLNPEDAFVWIGDADANTAHLPRPRNLLLLEKMTNPLPLLRHLDALLCTSRESNGLLLLEEAVALSRAILVCSGALGAAVARELGALGVEVLRGAPTLETWKRALYRREVFASPNSAVVEIQEFVDELLELSSGPLTAELRALYDHPKYGPVAYDWSGLSEKVAEARKPSDFDARAYLAKNGDLALGLTEDRALEHFDAVGHTSRSCAADDWQGYVASSPGLLEHFVDSRESCALPASGFKLHFDACLYRNNYADLKSFDDEECLQHWIHHGIWEGRIGASVSTLR